MISKSELAAHVSGAIEEIECNVDSLPDALAVLPGHTSPRQRCLLNTICDFEGCTYLEIGVFHGASLLSAAFDNGGGRFYGVDDFSYGTRDAFVAAYKQFENDCSHAKLIEGDIRELPLAALPEKVNVFYYDANWDDTAASNMLKRIASRLATTFILIVDNWSRPSVRRLTYDTLEELGFSIYASWQLTTKADCDITSWWSGWLVAIVEKKPMRDTTELRGFKEGEVPIWDISKRLEKKLLTIEDYK